MELPVVVVIIGILAAAAAPDMVKWFSKRDMVNATQTLYADIQAARMEAVKLNDKVAIVIDSSTSPHRYRIHRYSGTDGPLRRGRTGPGPGRPDIRRRLGGDRDNYGSFGE